MIRYILASAAGEEDAKIWDLRKLACVKTIETKGKQTLDIAFDESGHYCIFSGAHLT